MRSASACRDDTVRRLCRLCPFRPLQLPRPPVSPGASSPPSEDAEALRTRSPEPWTTLARHGVASAARSVGCSVRTFRRRYRVNGASPGATARLIRASWLLRLLASGTPVAKAAPCLGLSSAAALTRFSLSVLGERPGVVRGLLLRCVGTCRHSDRDGLTTFGHGLDEAISPSPD